MVLAERTMHTRQHESRPAPAIYSRGCTSCCYQPEIPYNTGSVGRTCVAVGAKLWLVRPLGFRVDDYYLRRAGLDYWEHLEWEVVDDWAALVAQLAGRTALVLHQEGDARVHRAAVTRGRRAGVRPRVQGLPESCCRRPGRDTRIPTRPEVRSLNLSNSVAVAVYEALRQWVALAVRRLR